MTDALAGVVVVERGTRLSIAAAGHLLASLGARVLRFETPEESRHLDTAPPGERMLRGAGKERIVFDEAAWRHGLAQTDVALVERAEDVDGKVVCAITPSGLDGGESWRDAPEPLLQALGGTMAATGYEGGPPEFARVPVSELYAAVVAVSSILAALRVRHRHGAGQLVDLSLIEVAADQLRVHLSMLDVDPRQNFRQGCRHPICAPWNAYRASDGWILVCASSNAQWHAVLDTIGQPDLKQDKRYATAFDRRARVEEVDALVQGWTSERTMRDAVAALLANSVPSGEARTIPGVMDDDVLRRRGTNAGGLFNGALALGRSSLKRGMTVAPVSVAPELPARRAPVPVTTRPDPPLAGIRVVEITRYTAGPLAGLILSSLGAEVIKIESPGGEESRPWQPQHDGASGYFINHNAGKRSVVLDLRDPGDKARLTALVADSDVLLQNLRPGVMEQIGLGSAEATARHPRLVHATISGFGLGGPALPALDTVVQGVGGLTFLIGDGKTPCRVGYSIADQMSGHLTALAILAALTERERSGLGQIVDVAMCDAIAWLTQLAWPDGRAAIGPCSRLEASDGWIAVAADEAAARAAIGTTGTREQLVAALARHGILAAPVLEPAEAFAQPVPRNRHSVFEIESGTSTARMLAMPFGLTLTQTARPRRMRALGEDNESLFATRPAAQ